MTVMFMTDAGRKTGDSKIDSLAMEYEDKYGQPLTEAQIERLDQLAGSPEYGDYAIDPSGFASDAPFGSPQRESEFNAYMKNLQDEKNAKRANFTLENLGILPDQTSPFTQPTAPQNPMQGGIGGLLEALQGQMKQIPQPPTQNRGMGYVQISPIERGPDPRLMGNMSFEEFFALPVEERLRISQEGRGAIENEAIGSQPKMPPQMPDMMQKLQEALRQKQMGGARPRPMPTPRGGRGDLGGIIGRLQQQMEQRQEAPPMQQRRRPRGGLFSQLSRGIPQDRRDRLARKISQDRRVKPMGRSLLTKGRGRPDMEEIRRQVMQGINVRGIGM
jgi:hypothetical protein